MASYVISRRFIQMLALSSIVSPGTIRTWKSRGTALGPGLVSMVE